MQSGNLDKLAKMGQFQLRGEIDPFHPQNPLT